MINTATNKTIWLAQLLTEGTVQCQGWVLLAYMWDEVTGSQSDTDDQMPFADSAIYKLLTCVESE